MDGLRVSLLIIGLVFILGVYLVSRKQLEDKKLYKRQPLQSAYAWLTSLASPISENFKKIKSSIGSRFSFRLPSFRSARFSQSENSDDYSDDDVPDKSILPLSNDEIESFSAAAVIPESKDSPQNIEQDFDDNISMTANIPSEQIAPDGEELFVAITINGRDERRFTGESILQAVETIGLEYGPDDLFYYKIKDSTDTSVGLLGLANIMEPGTFEPERMRTFDSPGLVLFLQLPAPIEARDAFDKLIYVGKELAQCLDGDLCDENRSVLTNQMIGHLQEKIEAYRFKQKMTQLKKQRIQHTS